MKKYPVLFKNKNMICYDKGLLGGFLIEHYKDRKEIKSVLCKLSDYPNVYINVTVYEGKSVYKTKRYGFITEILIKKDNKKWEKLVFEDSLIHEHDYWEERGFIPLIEAYVYSTIEMIEKKYSKI